MGINVDEDGTWHRPEYPRYKEPLAPPKPFLVPSFNDEVVEVLPSEKQNLKIRFDENVHIMEIENRFMLMEPEEFDDDESYEIEIVEGVPGDDDADFYLEMIDGEIFYVFETEDDISVDDDSYESDSDSDTEGNASQPVEPMQLDIGGLMAPSTAFNEAPPVQFEIGGPTGQLPTEICVEKDGDMSSVADDTSVSIEETQVTAAPSSASIGSGAQSAASFNPSAGPAELSPPQSPTRSVGGGSVSSDKKGILKPSLPSPTKKPKKKAPKKDKKEKTFTKTFVRVSDFDGEHRVYSWEKPTWTSKALKSTGKGDDIRKGGSLANPITDAAQLIQKGQVKWEKPEWALGDQSERDDTESSLNAKEELIRKIQDGSMNLPGRHKVGRLKLSINGSILAEGGDLVKPITKATIIKKPANINYIANPKILRATPGGSKLWKGENLAAPVTEATTGKGKYTWEKPSWAQQSKLNRTNSGAQVKNGKDPAISPTSAQKKTQWQKPDWAKNCRIGRSKSDDFDEKTKEYSWEKPSWVNTQLKKTSEKGALVKQGESLAKPITKLPQMAKDQAKRNVPSDRSIRRSLSND